jgi:Holliday junction resolvase
VNRARWKQIERSIAERLGGERVPVSGRTRGWAPDVQHDWLAIEVKSRATQFVLIQDMMDQARKAAEWAKKRGEGDKLPVGIYHVTGHHLDTSIIFMRLDDFEEWFGPEKANPNGEKP